MTASLYIHVPFCATLCDYCDFYSVELSDNDSRLEAYVDRVIADTATQFRRYPVEAVPTAYIGGGTPSALGPARMGRLLEGLRAILPQWPAECTVEANPESADGEFLAACRAGGVNRLSLGVQSFHGPSRRALGRAGNEGLLPERLALAAWYFPGAFSADLIAAFQDEAVLLEDIDRLLAYEPAHVSLYALTVEAGTPLYSRRNLLPKADEADRLWIAGRDALEAAGYRQYEVSNFCLPGKECRHNMRYWRLENWLATGPAASGTVISEDGGIRRSYPADVDAYLAGAPPCVEILDRFSLMEESLMMGFRCAGGPDGDRFRRRFGASIEDCIPRTLAAWRERGLVEPQRPAMNREGLLLLNAFLIDAFGELAEPAAG
ncbi:MAG: coproporphyrinogen III oxidase family protein, partial [Treponema sp.]|nr:coproporphyrinogen III oxidase family protein [Treponema sp.]